MTHRMVYGKGKREFCVTIGCSNPEYTVIFQETLRVRADSWRKAAEHVKAMDPFRVWRDYGALLRECKREPGLLTVTDAARSRVFFDCPVG